MHHGEMKDAEDNCRQAGLHQPSSNTESKNREIKKYIQTF